MNFFGGKKAKEAPNVPATTQPVVTQPINDEDMKFEQIINQVNIQINAFDQCIENYSERIDNSRDEAKKIMQSNPNNQKKAKSFLAQAKLLENHLLNAENQKIVFMKVKIQLENGKATKQSANVLKQAVDALKTIDTAVLEDTMDDLNEIEQTSKEISSLFQQMADNGIDKEELDEEMKQLEAEINKENALELQNKTANIPQPQLQNQQQIQPNIVTAPKQQAQAFDRAISDQLLE